VGTKVTKKAKGVANWDAVLGEGPVAQVGHPISLLWTPKEAINTLLAAAAELPRNVRMLVTGGGYISLDYPRVVTNDAEIRQPEFLSKLHAWTLSALSDVILAVGTPERDLVIGVDVSVNAGCSGQFALWIGQAGSALVPKRFPVGSEAKFLAGVDALHPGPYPRVVTTRVGRTLVLICHDAQAFNRRNRANVARAKQPTARMRAIQELHRERTTTDLEWALNVVHWIDGEPNTRTFHISYNQIRSDFPGAVSVAGGIGYGDNVSKNDVPALLDRLLAPRDMALTKVVIYR
jgi:hypothetical protein